ncbi:cytochrome c oxidase assembly protein [Cupriavidus sp. USMAA2-4]|uniref:SURF1-like protein n=1 Tax=Cupriavidus malaysiensis TaxID=367825 RepID=A0ABN4TCT4_9BURK|nr:MULTISPECIES: SURF1 family protein [Cupriavidus]AOY91877.1 cytochrome c oxidase assembly protein [Cupriavidus sp. USMAA2-4]AOY98564.1 cytochrome c oxidase assembly protein [Cupriavidus sp. USMAHM13]AOZ04994.1 cytochrome c oxidase assembly protein [Cupriavidus malaysiensis]
MSVRFFPARFFRPAPTLAALMVIALTCALGNWQLNRAHEKLARAARQQALAAATPLLLGPVPLAASADLADRRVRARGRFDAAHTVLLDNRPHGNGTDSRAGFLVLTPLRIAAEGGTGQGASVLVLRGWLPRDAQDRSRIAPFPTPAGEVDIDGMALAAVPKVYNLGSASEAGQKIRQNLDLAAYGAELGVTLQPLVLEQRNDTGDGLARDWAPADSGADRHYGYAFQWFGLAALTLVLLLALGWRRSRATAPAQASRMN